MEGYGWVGSEFYVSLILATVASFLVSYNANTLFASYINFAHGDEALQVVYGSSVSRLRSIKNRVDPKDWFNQWFNIT